jgi:hypothetical protein
MTAPQVGFPATIWKIKPLTFFESLLLPVCFLTLEMKLQYRRNSALMPTHHGLRGNHNERLLPGRPTAASEYPERFVEHAEFWFGMLAFQHGELLPERQIFQEQASA